MTMQKVFLSCILLVSLSVNAKQTHLLTGVISSAENQLVTAPKSDNWQVQIQWMAEEGSIVNKGDLVVVFDSGGIQAEVEQSQEQLEMEKLELKQIEMRLQQAVIDAQGRLKLAEIMVEKTKIQASIPDGEISAYEKGKHVIAYEKSLVEKIKAEESYKLSLEEQKVGIQKQKIQIIKLKENIAYKSNQLTKMSVVSQVTGPVSHMMHPYMPGEKVATGMNVRVSTKVLMVQAQSSYQVTTWVHELDASRINFDSAEVMLTLDAYPNHEYSGKIIDVLSQAEQKTEWSDSAYYRMDLTFSEEVVNEIFPGMSVRIKLSSDIPELAGVAEYD
ncbi:HlyD family efflux transporter periplasmic adaptor subunit [Paraglaciecola aquimarina]|uniref:HlyD family efflux transporter periplasmic adaptor subunit n=1 Tax=Paraglaciecola algarum TaxID=3050085 RepID=A0ABS9DCU9_9ALTE|nr:HlyD family efflux transporter periplasmic adaptor subunit [Paraglaciecola sp. G1-23]MCF2949466.1 HlyD family efflux transporter periplasmic adaptor subunit [Paraglaciecola sp. G1-23]